MCGDGQCGRLHATGRSRSRTGGQNVLSVTCRRGKLLHRSRGTPSNGPSSSGYCLQNFPSSVGGNCNLKIRGRAVFGPKAPVWPWLPVGG